MRASFPRAHHADLLPDVFGRIIAKKDPEIATFDRHFYLKCKKCTKIKSSTYLMHDIWLTISIVGLVQLSYLSLLQDL